MSSTTLRRALAPWIAAAALVACRADKTSTTGIRLGDETLKQFQIGEATERWLIAVVGPPTSRTDLPDEGISILRYSTVEASSGVMSFFSGKGSRNTATIYFIVRDGLVSQMWADREKERTLLGKEVEKKSGEKEE